MCVVFVGLGAALARDFDIEFPETPLLDSAAGLNVSSIVVILEESIERHSKPG